MLPHLRSAFGFRRELSAKIELRICHLSTVALGGIIIVYSILIAKQSAVDLFDAYLIIGSVIGVPMGFPTFMGLWLKKLPKWSYFPIFISCMIPSVWSFIDGYRTGVQWSIQERTMWIMLFGIATTMICRMLYSFTSVNSRKELEEFFTTMHSPVDYEKEVGSSKIDYEQYFVLAKATALVGTFVLLLLFVPNDFKGKLCIVIVAAFILSASGLLYMGGNRTRPKVEAILLKKQPTLQSIASDKANSSPLQNQNVDFPLGYSKTTNSD